MGCDYSKRTVELQNLLVDWSLIRYNTIPWIGRADVTVGGKYIRWIDARDGNSDSGFG
jgi:hypothetical protein